MKMDDNKLKHLIQEAMEMDADRIMDEVNSAPEMSDVVAPEDIHDKLFQQIREYEASKKNEESALTKEQEELIRLGKKYKKKISRRKYYILVAAVVCALAVGTVSFGDGKKVMQEVKNMIAGKTQVNIDENGERTGEIKTISEEEAYQKIEDEFGFWPVKMYYLPEGMDFEEVVIEKDTQIARLYYTDKSERMISYYVTTNNREGSIGTDVEDQLINEYEKEIDDVPVQVQEYEVEKNETKRWRILFVYNDAQYIITMTGIEEAAVEKIIDNLYFL